MTVARTRVLIVDDSSTTRKVLKEILERAGDIEVVGTAADALSARDMLLETTPDVMTLDIEMPKIDGLTFLKAVMEHRPMPVIVVSGFTQLGSPQSAAALEAGAVDVLPKPQGSDPIFERMLVERVRLAARARVGRAVPRPAASPAGLPARAPLGAPANTPLVTPSPTASAAGYNYSPGQLIAIGSSTGGTTALQTVVSGFPANLPPVVIVQHIQAGFSTAFAQRLNSLSSMDIQEAKDNEILRPGMCRIAPGDIHVVVEKAGAGLYKTRLKNGPRVCFQRPAADVLMQSVARVVGDKAMGVILTGMGDDGADGLSAMKAAGSYNIGQDEATSVVYGMPKAAAERGVLDKVVPLDGISSTIVRCLKKAS